MPRNIIPFQNRQKGTSKPVLGTFSHRPSTCPTPDSDACVELAVSPDEMIALLIERIRASAPDRDTGTGRVISTLLWIAQRAEEGRP